MKKVFKKSIACIAALMCMNTVFYPVKDNNYASVAEAVSSSDNRGITAVSTGSGMLVSWKFRSSDARDTVFNLYRDDQLIYTSEANQATCYLDKDGNTSSIYRVDTLSGGAVKTSDICTMISGTNYFQINLDVPAAQTSGVTYSPNDCSIGDADGDGVNEIFVKWDPSNSQDNSKSGITDKVFIDCYKLDGKKLWRIDLGINIRAGAHYTQMLVADFDNDGYAELTCKTSDGTVDGTGKVIGDASADYRNSSGYILTGNEYYTLFDGRTGAALDTVKYNPPRGDVSSWGDKYGNRLDRYLGAVAYLDADHPSAVTIRGYYTRMTACAYDVVNKKLVQRWYMDSNNAESAVAYGNGNHNCMPADVDGDGKQEIVLGATCIDDNGSILWCTGKGHGDALHVGDLLPERAGLEVWVCHEEAPYGVSLIDAATGEIILHRDGGKDTGRCCADNVWAGNDGAEFWGLGNDVLNGSGTVLSMQRPAINFLCYWDGDLERELLDGNTVSKVNADGKISNMFVAEGCSSNNSTKATPNLSGDILGDWREEVILRTDDNKSLRIFCTTYETEYRIDTLMDDTQYRTQVAGENISYNQPPHLSYYLGSDADIPHGSGTVVQPNKAAVLPEGAVFTIKNVNSGMYMEVAEGSAANGANVQQSSSGTPSAQNTWRAVSAGNGYYYLYSQVGDKITYCLDVTAKKPDNGTNMEIYTTKLHDAQQFKFIENADGSYRIHTKVSGDKSCVEVVSAELSEGANIQEWEKNGHACQNWILEQVTDSGTVMDTSQIYMFRNVASGMYMDIAGGVQAEGTNVQQWAADGSAAYNSWTLEDAGEGYYHILSQLGDGKTYYLDVEYGKADVGTNVQIWTDTKADAQLFKFILNPDGTYTIATKASKDICCLETDGTGNGANLVQSSMTIADNQKWTLESAGKIPEETTVSETEKPDDTTRVTETEKPDDTTTVTETEKPDDTTAVTETEKPDDTSEPEKSETEYQGNILLGDVTVDGEVDIRDITMLNQYIVNMVELSSAGWTNANVVADNVVDVKDLGQLKKYIIKLIEKF